MDMEQLFAAVETEDMHRSQSRTVAAYLFAGKVIARQPLNKIFAVLEEKVDDSVIIEGLRRINGNYHKAVKVCIEAGWDDRRVIRALITRFSWHMLVEILTGIGWDEKRIKAAGNEIIMKKYKELELEKAAALQLAQKAIKVLRN
ncbi:hypothetical protein A2V71_02905 [Candidatus Berkelbacteria bacterium RBG_13_40_8]|uniref:Uncharacterized protein n=1 Tax=Candidatus Berkelbacteria bacterium RBG_13_40_8 TaxID=1797467 RepID=A0A1F5DMK1_9BACT|nr:MAG: hypothetical protein A2V71_02905 [Candidatus Berkelbacteria bacterium RBG_13_40_8]